MTSAEFIYNLGFEAGKEDAEDEIATAYLQGQHSVWRLVKDSLKNVAEFEDEGMQVLWQLACANVNFADEKGADNE